MAFWPVWLHQAMLSELWRWRRRGGGGEAEGPPHIMALQQLQVGCMSLWVSPAVTAPACCCRGVARRCVFSSAMHVQHPLFGHRANGGHT